MIGPVNPDPFIIIKRKTILVNVLPFMILNTTLNLEHPFEKHKKLAFC
jgi:hypothetical protein